MPEIKNGFEFIENPSDEEISNWLMFQYKERRNKPLREKFREDVKNVSDLYVKKLILRKHKIPAKIINKEVIDCERMILITKRALRRVANKNNFKELVIKNSHLVKTYEEGMDRIRKKATENLTIFLKQ